MTNFVRLSTLPVRRYGNHMENIDGHNMRKCPAMSNTADPARTYLNRRIVGYHDETLREAVYNRIEDAGVALPENALSVAQELTLGASPEYFRPDYHPDDPDGWGKYDEDRLDKWLDATMDYLYEKYGKANIVAADLHLDERTPHLHAVVVPICEVELKKRRTRAEIARDNAVLAENPDAGIKRETYKKLKWNRSELFDLKSHYEMQEDYGNYMERVGLQRGIPKKITKMKNKEVIEWHKERRKVFEKDETKRTSVSFVAPKIRKKKFFESPKDYIAEMLERFKKANETNRKRLNKELREAEDAKRNAEKIALDALDKNAQMRQKMGILAHYDHNKIIEVLDRLEQEHKLEKENRQEQRKSKGHNLPTLSTPSYEPS